MQTHLFSLPDALAHALGWTLIHSFWQGIVVALSVALLLWLMRRQSALSRYWVAYSALMMQFGLVVWTFSRLYMAEKAVYTEGGVLGKNGGDSTVWWSIQIVGNQGFMSQCLDSVYTFFNQHLTSITLAWAFGFFFFSFKLLYGWWLLRGRQKRGGAPLDSDWQAKLRQVQRQVSISRPIQLVEAAWVEIPLTIGWLKPMIFFPIGIVNRLNVAEVEAILAHELAHIAGRDYLFNFLQAFVEVLLYFHPAVWWLSSVIRHERELRCDDTAIQLCGGNRLAYAKMLVTLQEQFEATNAQTPHLALAFGKRPSPLFRRIKRLFPSPNKQSGIMEKMMITGLLLCGMFLFSFAKNEVSQKENSPQNAVQSLVSPDKTLQNSTVLSQNPNFNPQNALYTEGGILGKDSVPFGDFATATILNRADNSKYGADTSAAFSVILLDNKGQQKAANVDTIVRFDPRAVGLQMPELKKDTTPKPEPAKWAKENGVWVLKSKAQIPSPVTPNPATPPDPKPGRCYAYCYNADGSDSQWREVVCDNLLSSAFVSKIVNKLKASGDLAASFSGTEITKDVRNAVVSYQKNNKLPVGNLNIETIEHMGIEMPREPPPTKKD